MSEGAGSVDHLRCSVDAGKLLGTGVAAGQRSEQIPRPTSHIEYPVGRWSDGHREIRRAIGDLVVQPAAPAALVSIRAVVERGDVPVWRHRV